jgi:hypothetical protein
LQVLSPEGHTEAQTVDIPWSDTRSPLVASLKSGCRQVAEKDQRIDAFDGAGGNLHRKEATAQRD